MSGIKNIAIKLKVWVQRGAGYLSILNTGLILLVFLKNYGIELSAKIWGGVIYVISVGLIVLVGYLDDKFGFYKAEIQQSQEYDEKLKQIQDDVRMIKHAIYDN